MSGESNFDDKMGKDSVPPGMLPDGTLNIVQLGDEKFEPEVDDNPMSDLDDYDELFGIGKEGADKKPKEEVGYVGPGRDRPNGQRCEKCTMFEVAAEDSSDPGTCTAVAGEIDPAGWCEIFVTPNEY